MGWLGLVREGKGNGNCGWGMCNVELNICG